MIPLPSCCMRFRTLAHLAHDNLLVPENDFRKYYRPRLHIRTQVSCPTAEEFPQL